MRVEINGQDLKMDCKEVITPTGSQERNGDTSHGKAGRMRQYRQDRTEGGAGLRGL